MNFPLASARFNAVLDSAPVRLKDNVPNVSLLTAASPVPTDTFVGFHSVLIIDPVFWRGEGTCYYILL